MDNYLYLVQSLHHQTTEYFPIISKIHFRTQIIRYLENRFFQI